MDWFVCNHLDRVRAIRIASITLLLAIICLAMGMVQAPAAQAKDYSVTKDQISATVASDGSLHVQEARTFSFNGSFTLVGYILDPPANGDYRVNGVAVIDQNGTRTALAKVPFQLGWRDAGGPGDGHYSIDGGKDTIYAFSDSQDTTKTIIFDFTYTNAVNVYNDVSELYWQFVAKGWDIDTNNVTMTVTLPVPSGESVTAGENVRAWAHGPLDGTVAFDSSGTITYTVPTVASGSFAEARITYPASWSSKASSSVRKNSDGLASILAEEQNWADQANQQRMIAWLWIIIPLILSLLILIWAFVMFSRHGREYKPEFQEKYWRDVPEKGMHPAIIARIWRWNKVSSDDLTASLMHLGTLGAVKIEQLEQQKERLIGGPKTEKTYRIVRTGRGEDKLDAIDRETLATIFDHIANGKDEVTIEDIRQAGKDDPEAFVNFMDTWQGALTGAVDREELYERKGDNLSKLMNALAVIYLVIVVSLSVGVIQNYIPIIAAVPTAIILFVIAANMKRRSRKAVEIQARSEGLKRWFKDFTALNESIPTDAIVWGELLVYAYIFGVAEDVIKALKVKVPELWNDPYFSGIWLWYWAPIGYHGSFGSVFDQGVSNTLNTAHTALSQSSSGGGFGGGFSMGGGGGFGGGGGGFAR